MIDENVGGNELAQQEGAVTNNNNVDSQNTSSESKIEKQLEKIREVLAPQSQEIGYEGDIEEPKK